MLKINSFYDKRYFSMDLHWNNAGQKYYNDAWYDTLMLFPFGVLLTINEKAFIDITRKYPIAIIGVATLLSGLVIYIQKVWCT